MDNPPEKPSLPETTPTPADKKRTSVEDAAESALLLEQFVAATRHRNKRFYWCVAAMYIALPVLLVGVFFHASSFYDMFWKYGLLACGAGTAALLAMWYHTRAVRPSTATMRLAEQCSSEALGPLLARIDICSYPEERELLWATVTNLLKRFQPDDAVLLNGHTRTHFNQRLSSAMQNENAPAEHVEFCFAWLKILEQVGDARDLRTVEYIASMPVYVHFHSAMQGEAKECLRHIKARIAAQEPGRTLLRASAQEPNAPETLLRPAAKSNPTAPRDLLRPAELNNDSPSN